MKVYISKANELKEKYSNFNDWKAAMVREYGNDIVYRTDEIWKILSEHENENVLDNEEIKRTRETANQFRKANIGGRLRKPSEIISDMKVGKELNDKIDKRTFTEIENQQLAKKAYLLNQIIKTVINKNPQATKINKIAETIEEDVQKLVTDKGDKTDLIYKLKKKIGDDISLSELETLVNNLDKVLKNADQQDVTNKNKFTGSIERNIIIIAKLIIIALIIIGFYRQPIGYYTFLRFAVMIVSIVNAYNSYKNKNEIWAWIFGTIAVLFNPIVPIHFDRNIWAVIDIITILILLASLISYNPIIPIKKLIKKIEEKFKPKLKDDAIYALSIGVCPFCKVNKYDSSKIEVGYRKPHLNIKYRILWYTLSYYKNEFLFEVPICEKCKTDFLHRKLTFPSQTTCDFRWGYYRGTKNERIV
jgi:hypothetical protein